MVGNGGENLSTAPKACAIAAAVGLYFYSVRGHGCKVGKREGIRSCSDEVVHVAVHADLPFGGVAEVGPAQIHAGRTQVGDGEIHRGRARFLGGEVQGGAPSTGAAAATFTLYPHQVVGSWGQATELCAGGIRGGRLPWLSIIVDGEVVKEKSKLAISYLVDSNVTQLSGVGAQVDADLGPFIGGGIHALQSHCEVTNGIAACGKQHFIALRKNVCHVLYPEFQSSREGDLGCHEPVVGIVVSRIPITCGAGRLTAVVMVPVHEPSIEIGCFPFGIDGPLSDTVFKIVSEYERFVLNCVCVTKARPFQFGAVGGDVGDGEGGRLVTEDRLKAQLDLVFHIKYVATVGFWEGRVEICIADIIILKRLAWGIKRAETRINSINIPCVVIHHK